MSVVELQKVPDRSQPSSTTRADINYGLWPYNANR